ncbi:MAG: dTDP-glucose 4,6-dehydratase [Actinomycetes bacterium]|jgi:dTDP-glucose 4,6-dehydratase|nr:dTDP-glucose 4,6-dehydratase [Actinomycetes bacterium]
MKFLITGCAGFIGANHVYYLLEHHAKDVVVGVDALTYSGNWETLADAIKTDGFEFVHADICDAQSIDALFSRHRFDVVINYAAETHVDRSIVSPQVFLRSNIIGTQVLMDACLKYDVPRFHQISTDEVYGDLPLDRPDLQFTETTPLHASSPYSASKAAADLLIQAYVRTYGLPATISRCSNNYGPWQFPEKLIPLMITNALADKPLPVYGKGQNVRDWLHVRDHVNAVDRIVRKGAAGEIYNVGGNNEHANIEVVRMILSALDKPDSLIQFVTDRKGHDLRYAIDAGKIREELDWMPSITFAEGIQNTIDWYLNNTTWWRRILSGAYRADSAMSPETCML